jgi:glutathione synthase/RimK-type ligase-like ATP-grasp enzyme
MPKTIAFFVRNIDPDKYPFSVRDLYYYSYQEFLLAIKRAGAEAYFVTDNETYLGQGRFSRAYTINKVSEVKDFKDVGEIQADLVFEKGGFLGRDITIVTDPRLYPLISDKGAIYEKFSKFQPKTVVCSDAESVAMAIAAMPGEMVVVKNPVSSGGRQVYIGTKSEIVVPSSETYPLLVQEFIDMSDGIPGITNGVHDVRVLLIGNEIIGATLRIPPAGSLYANVSKGAVEHLLAPHEIPNDVVRMAQEIDSQMDDLPRYYAIDFARGKHGWVLVEINTRPGLFRQNTGPLAQEFQRKAAEYIVSQA